MQQTFIMIKPDGVQRAFIAKIISKFQDKGYFLVALKMLIPSQEILKVHYSDLSDKTYFDKYITYMASGPVVCMVWQGLQAVKMGRKMLGVTNPIDSLPRTIRGDFGIDVGRTICHASDSVQNARKEKFLWFKSEQISQHKQDKVE